MRRLGRQIWRRVLAWKWRILLVYLCLLLISFVVRSRAPREPVAPDVQVMSVPAIRGKQTTNQTVRLAYREYACENSREAPVVVLLHGSPGNHRDFQKLAPELATQYRVIVPDLPGFGSSSHSIPDYSTRAHARYVLELLDQLQVSRAHFIGFSMGGGVVLNIADIAPKRVESIVMLSAIGVQEMELLENYYLNHSLHGLQLAGLWLMREGLPHFGWLDHSMLDVSYARNFYDTDQRPLRSILASYAGPMLIIHGERDIMVPVQAAREHYRLVPQSELRLFPNESHFYLFAGPNEQAALTTKFLDRVEKGQAVVRATADPRRVAMAVAPFNPAASIPRAMGPTALVVFALLALATLVSEDLTCIWAGVLAAEGRISFGFAAIACLVGIFVGDILLFLAGRLLGRPVLRHAPLKWFVRSADVARSSAWFRRRGMSVIAISRFLPGTRLPTYVAAGLLDTSLLKFMLYFFVAAALWTPLLVGLSMLLGAQVIESTFLSRQSLLLKVVVSALLALITIKLLIRLVSFHGRRLLLARVRKLTQWEFWPPWVFYPPVVFYVLYLGIRHRNLTLFTCANPAIEAGGFIGESKSAILQALVRSPESRRFIAPLAVLEGSLSYHILIEHARDFMTEHSLSFPIVLKPDVGQRGSGVAVVRSQRQMEDYLRACQGTDVIIQEYVAGGEFGVFYYRYPESEQGRILSITKKQFPSVVGNGKSSLEELILKDSRAACMARAYFDAQCDRLWDVPEQGESVQLVEIGTHCRGSIFLDGGEVETDPMRAAIDRIARAFEGFYFGRFDIRTSSLADFQQGQNFKVVELNGVSSEATHIYDPGNSLFTAYRILFNQWRLAFEIGAQSRRLGCAPTPLGSLLRLLIEQWWKNRERSPLDLRPIRVEAEASSQLASEV
jgi:pimeloyl-ACP methyl ester carboxylesterase/membrane protein DedA with SNARE-associated domain